MTHITFFKNSDKEITGFYSAGHAGYAESGKDIVCASVSSAVQLTVNLLYDFQCVPKVGALGNLVRCFTNAEPDTADKIINQFLCHLDSIAEEFPRTIKITISEV